MASQTSAGELGDRARVLVLAPASTGTDRELCQDLLASASPTDQRVLVVTFDRRPAEIAGHWRTEHGDLPSELAVVCPPAAAGDDGDLADGVYATTVDPSDVTGSGIAISRYLDRWHDDGRPVRVCLDSLTTLLRHADRDRVFRFVHTITSRCMAADARLHVHLDPTVQDDQTVATVATLFDAVVERSGDEWTTRSV